MGPRIAFLQSRNHLSSLLSRSLRSDRRNADHKEFSVIDLRHFPRWISDNYIKAAPAHDIRECDGPMKEAILSSNVCCRSCEWFKWRTPTQKLPNGSGCSDHLCATPW